MYKKILRTASFTASLLLAPGWIGVAGMSAQAPASTSAASAPHQTGTVKAITPHDFVLTNSGGQDFAVTVPDGARILLVAPGSRDLGGAKPGTISDLAAGDRVIVNGTVGDTGPMLTATRVIVMKSTAIAATHAQQEAAWAHGAGGIVRAVDPASGVITVSSGMQTLSIDTSAQTVIRRYTGGSVRFEDAVRSDLGSIQPGDQIRARGQRSADGSMLVADEIVTGSFSNFSGVLSGIDTALGTVTLKDLATKRTVTVAVTDRTNLRRLPAGAAQMAGRAQAGATGGQAQAPAAGQPAGTGRYPAGSGRSGAGMDLSRMLNRLPTEALANLKPGDAVMMVASNNAQTGRPTAINLLVGVEQVLAASPSGETTLSPWSLGAGGEGQGGEGAGGP